jgi:UDP-glucuronate 4-epimerase
MKILVTGCAGFIGYNLTKFLCNSNEFKDSFILGLDNFDPYYDINIKKNNIQNLKKLKNFSFFCEDIRNTNIINIEKPDIIVHLAGLAGVRNSIQMPQSYSDVNINGMINLLEQSKNNNVKRFLFASSSSVYGSNSSLPFNENHDLDNIISPYALSKKVMEDYGKLYSKMYNMNIIGFRFFTVYGPGGRPDMAPYKFIFNIKNNIEINKFGKGDSMRDYTYIDDIVYGIIGGIKNNIAGFNIFNLGNSKPVTLNIFIELCEKVCNKKAKINQLDIQMGDVFFTYADITKSKKYLGYEPKVTLEEGLKRLYDSL